MMITTSKVTIQFSNLNDEYKAIYTQSGLFDLFQTGILLLKGERIKDKLQLLVPTDLNRIGPGESCRTIILNEEGGIENRITIHDRGHTNGFSEVILIINDFCTVAQDSWIWRQLDLKGILISDLRKTSLHFALEGPMAKAHLKEITQNTTVINMAPFSNCVLNLNGIYEGMAAGATILITRISNLGKDGFEILIRDSEGISLWDYFILKGIKPCGLATWDILRLETYLQVYDFDLDFVTSPFEASLGHLVHLEMPELFMGRQALEAQIAGHIYYCLVGLIIEGSAIPNRLSFVLQQDVWIGQIRSGGWSPTLSKAIALAYISKEVVKTYEYVTVNIWDKMYTARIMKIPFC
uniref:Putative Glycine cleavage T-protein (Aminomethyl transferase) n=1 Tax=Paulinella longichromatophora TaxID=1708747 RepID=A0A2H4ZPB3_9EUKA|nr:putative Glycine cleavage T-protein (aminomethyl transferase) [Paulinella longichromatophora]